MVIIKTLILVSIVLFSTNAFGEKCTSSFSKSFSISSDVGFGNKYVASKHFHFSHGVYSANKFDYVLKSKISMNKVN